MAKKQLKFGPALLAGSLLALLTFLLFYTGVAVLLAKPVQWENVLAMGVLALILGSLAFLFVLFRLYYAFGFFATSFALGGGLMLSTFLKGVAGWEDLIGLISFLFILGIGLGSGLLVQLIVWLVKRSRKT